MITNKKYLYQILPIIGFILLVTNLVSANNYKIAWLPEKIETSVFQGGARTISLSFQSGENISNATVWIVPELKPFISIQPDNFPFIKAGEKVELLATIKIPKTQPLGAIEGTIHIRVGKKTIAKPLPIKLNITDTGIVESKLEDLLIQQFGTTTPEIPPGQQFLTIEPSQEIIDLVSTNSNLPAVFKVGSIVFSRNLIPDDRLKTAGFDLLQLLKTKGAKIDEWNNSLFSNLWHSDDPNDPLLAQSEYAAMLPPALVPGLLPAIIFRNGHIIIITDENTRIIMRLNDAEVLYVKNYLDTTGAPTAPASTAFHELLHVFHFRTECGGSSWVGTDNEEEYVAMMETFIKHLFQNLDSQYLTSEINFIISNYPRSYSCLQQLYLTPPTPSTLSYSDLTSNSVKLNWTKNEDPDFLYYRLYRAIVASGVPQAILVTTFNDPNITSFIDTGLSPNTRYDYRLRTYDQAGLFSRSNLISVITPAAPSIPFLVPFANISIDGDISDWQNIQPAHIDPAGDSLGTLPGTDFTNFYLARDNQYLYFRIDFANGLPREGDNIYYQTNLDLSPRGPMAPEDSIVFFWNRHTQSWVTVLRLSDETSYTDTAATGGSSLETRARLDFIGNPGRLFVALNINENNQWVDWQKADFEVELELIPPIPPPIPPILSIVATSTKSVSLSWTQSAESDFKEYRLHRTTLGSGYFPTDLIAVVTDRAQTSFTDVNLPFGVYDYYLETHYSSGLFLRSNDVRAELPFFIPYANITIDGDISDWQGIPPAIIDQIGDKLGDYSGTDIDKVYLARDDSYLYFRIDLADGPPNSQYERPSIGFHTALHQNPDPQAVPGDYFLFGYFGYGSWRASLYQVGVIAYDELAAAGFYSLEMTVSLFRLLDPAFLYIATHMNFGQEGFDWTPWVKVIFPAP